MVVEPKILLIGEDLDYLRPLAETFTSHAYTVKIAHESRDAVNIVVEYKPDLILLDLDFTSADEGLRTCRSLRKTIDSPMIVLSENSDETEKIRYLNLCADRFIERPCKIDLLLSSIHSVIRLWLGYHES